MSVTSCLALVMLVLSSPNVPAYNALKNGDFSGGIALPNWNHSGPASWGVSSAARSEVRCVWMPTLAVFQ